MTFLIFVENGNVESDAMAQRSPERLQSRQLDAPPLVPLRTVHAHIVLLLVRVFTFNSEACRVVAHAGLGLMPLFDRASPSGTRRASRGGDGTGYILIVEPSGDTPLTVTFAASPSTGQACRYETSPSSIPTVEHPPTGLTQPQRFTLSFPPEPECDKGDDQGTHDGTYYDPSDGSPVHPARRRGRFGAPCDTGRIRPSLARAQASRISPIQDGERRRRAQDLVRVSMFGGINDVAAEGKDDLRVGIGVGRSGDEGDVAVDHVGPRGNGPGRDGRAVAFSLNEGQEGGAPSLDAAQTSSGLRDGRTGDRRSRCRRCR